MAQTKIGVTFPYPILAYSGPSMSGLALPLSSESNAHAGFPCGECDDDDEIFGHFSEDNDVEPTEGASRTVQIWPSIPSPSTPMKGIASSAPSSESPCFVPGSLLTPSNTLPSHPEESQSTVSCSPTPVVATEGAGELNTATPAFCPLARKSSIAQCTPSVHRAPSSARLARSAPYTVPRQQLGVNAKTYTKGCHSTLRENTFPGAPVNPEMTQGPARPRAGLSVLVFRFGFEGGDNSRCGVGLLFEGTDPDLGARSCLTRGQRFRSQREWEAVLSVLQEMPILHDIRKHVATHSAPPSRLFRVLPPKQRADMIDECVQRDANGPTDSEHTQQGPTIRHPKLVVFHCNHARFLTSARRTKLWCRRERFWPRRGGRSLGWLWG